jgi:hypothetical protein
LLASILVWRWGAHENENSKGSSSSSSWTFSWSQRPSQKSVFLSSHYFTLSHIICHF